MPELAKLNRATIGATVAGLMSLNDDDIHGFPRYWEQLFNEGDYKTIAAHYTQDAQLIATQLPTIVGREAIEAFWRAAVEAIVASGARRTVVLDHVERDGSLAYMRGSVEVTGAATITTRYVTVWNREPDGQWRLAIDISSNAPAAS
jgi:ketosteroid isomerase-like protein